MGLRAFLEISSPAVLTTAAIARSCKTHEANVLDRALSVSGHQLAQPGDPWVVPLAIIMKANLLEGAPWPH